MRFSLFVRRKQRLAKLAAVLPTADDQTLRALLAKPDAESIALVLKALPLERSNVLLAALPKELVRDAFSLVAGVTLGQQQNAPSRAGAISEIPIRTAEGARMATPVCVRALDLAGKVFGADTSDDFNESGAPRA